LREKFRAALRSQVSDTLLSDDAGLIDREISVLRAALAAGRGR
jgi:hypothetical protein